jgi:RNA polymerase-binding transcription factor DksA
MATKKALPKKAAKKAAKPAKKAPAPKKAVKPAAKKASKVSKPAPKKAAAKKPVPAKKVAAKPVKKAAPKKVTKPEPKAAPKKAPVAINKKAAEPAKKVAAKSIPVKAAPVKPAVKSAPAKTAEPAKKTVVETIKEVAKAIIQPVIKPAKKEPPKPVKVVIPKTSTTKSVKYEPDFTKSVLDSKNNQENTGPTMRYSDAELAEFRELINKKLDTAKKELAYLQGLITRKDEGGDLDEGRYMTMEDGSMSMEREQLSQMASRQIQFIDHLEKAIMRIENKTYGICRVTGKLIDKARLRAVPHATLSIEAKQMMNK